MPCFGNGRTPVSLLILAVAGGFAYGLYYRRRRLWVRYGLVGDSRRAAFCYRHPYKPAILMGMMAAVFVAGTPELAMATPTYDPVFYYYHGDHLGSASVMTDRDGLMVQRYGYRPFGDERYKDNTLAFSVSNRYTNQVLDEDTGLYYYGARYYDPKLARFTQPDTIVPDPGSSQALNRYSYVYNNPLRFTDPTGNDPFTLFIFFVVASAVTSGAIAAAQGGNIWKAALGGAMRPSSGKMGK